MCAKQVTLYTCSNCDAQFQKWAGRCLECGHWGSIEAQATTKKEIKEASKPQIKAKTTALQDVDAASYPRMKTGISELDRVLGGGIVPGSLILLGGEPGIGKSTLSLQLAASVSKTLYISGEESIYQIKSRAERLAIAGPNIALANETNVDTIVSTVREQKPPLTIVDSIQTIHTEEIPGSAGSPNQIRACTVALMETAKSLGCAMIIIGHVTKDGAVAGPKTLEHLVDTVLYVEGERHHNLRMVRAVKNRFGSTDEIGVFEMKESGLEEVPNPSSLLLAERGDNMPGSVVTCLMEGSRPILVEVQALVNKTVFGYPQRKASGFDLNRLHVLAAVLERRAGLALGQYDIHINVVGGLKANEPAADLAVSLAIASAFKDSPLGKDLAVFGEVGLGGEVRSVRFIEKRMKECAHLGMKRVITKKTGTGPKELQIIDVKNISELIKQT